VGRGRDLKNLSLHSTVASEKNSGACPTVHRLVELTITTCDRSQQSLAGIIVSKLRVQASLQDTKSHSDLHKYLILNLYNDESICAYRRFGRAGCLRFQGLKQASPRRPFSP
jgi:hypothetical protein